MRWQLEEQSPEGVGRGDGQRGQAGQGGRPAKPSGGGEPAHGLSPLSVAPGGQDVGTQMAGMEQTGAMQTESREGSIFTCVSVRLSELENSARSAMDKYCFWRNLRSSASSCAVVKGVLGLRLVLCFRRVQAGGLSRPRGPRDKKAGG